MNTPILIIGIILMVIGVFVYFTIQPDVSNCGSFVGQFGQVISTNISSGCQTVYQIQTISAVIVVVGLGLTIAGAVMKNSSQTTTNRVLAIIASIIAFFGFQMIFPFPYGIVFAIISVIVIIFPLFRNRKKQNY
ncbi:hypothetical protein NKOR_03870 [Candidatus Nitrosopumilus koreensis AR1]|uniref:Uncharacterized protein n=1 Tax=Candidatus Nitrosopumilus koreensis AR1 TaxID=1229908 RepID=K0B5C7_9ARCH|nr:MULTISPECIES: hypothetical protein [Nitrosopumilus]AFS80664.1 hypothetical protein NKOR_03870 [Candidatus Nitrosopumilus koreensis AR1]